MIEGIFSHPGGKMRASLCKNVGLDMVLEAAKNRLAVKGLLVCFSFFTFFNSNHFDLRDGYQSFIPPSFPF